MREIVEKLYVKFFTKTICPCTGMDSRVSLPLQVKVARDDVFVFIYVFVYLCISYLFLYELTGQ